LAGLKDTLVKGEKDLSERMQSLKPASKQENIHAGLTSITVRISPEVVEKLKIVAAQRKVARQKPASQQEIIEVALRDWFERNGLV
jgi:hypothetical protein